MNNHVRVAINGFGRIGRNVLRGALSNPKITVVAINDLSPVSTQAHLLKYDSVHRTLPQSVQVEGSELKIQGSAPIRLLSQKDPSQLPWKNLEIDIVLECTGVFTDKDKAQVHLASGAKKVIISAPSKDADGTFVYGINHKSYDPKTHHIVSNASCTTNCLAPLVYTIDQAFGIEMGSMTTVHSYTNDQQILDLAHKDLRRARAAALSMIPTSTGAAKAIGLVLPHLKGKLDGYSVRVPTPDVSLVDLTVLLKKDATKDAVNQALIQSSQGALKGILDCSDLPLVSTDYIGSPFSSIVDLELTQVLGARLVKVVAWYDNEIGFSQRMLDLALHMGSSL